MSKPRIAFVLTKVEVNATGAIAQLFDRTHQSVLRWPISVEQVPALIAAIGHTFHVDSPFGIVPAVAS